MTTTKPASSLDWQGSQVEPSSGAKVAGFALGDRPTAENLNWMFGNADLWIKFLKAVFGDVVAQPGFTFDGDSDQFARALALRAETSAYLNARTVSAGTSLASLAAAEQRIVAVGQAGEIKTSDDLGATWTSRTAGSSYSGDFASAHFYNSSMFLAAGSSGEIQSSTDGASWTRRATTAFTGFGVLASRGSAVVAVGDAGGAGGAVSYSANGTSWTAVTPLVGVGFILYDVAASQSGAAVFVAVGYGGSADRTNYLHRSTNGGSSWSAVSLTGVLASTEFVEQVVWHASLGFVGLVRDSGSGEYSCVIVSADGQTWSKRGSASLGAVGVGDSSHLVATVGGLMLLASSSGWQSLSSLDGDTWVQLPFTKPHDGSGADFVRFAKFAGRNAYMLLWPKNGNVHLCGSWTL